MLIRRHRANKRQQNPVYSPAPLGPGQPGQPGIPEMSNAGVIRKPVAMTHSNSVYSSANSAVSPVSASPNPPQYSNLASNAPERYDPTPPPPHDPYAGYSEMEGGGRQHENRAELRGNY